MDGMDSRLRNVAIFSEAINAKQEGRNQPRRVQGNGFLILTSSWGRGFVSFASGVLLHFNFLHSPEESGLHLYAFLWGGDLRSKLNCSLYFCDPNTEPEAAD